jgi:hypothetical protein
MIGGTGFRAALSPGSERSGANMAGLAMLVSLVCIAAAPATASASSVLGSGLAFNGNGAAQGGCNPLCTFIPTDVSGANPVVSPINGVVVRWGASAADGAGVTSTVRLRVVSSPAANQWIGLRTGPTEHTGMGFANSFFNLKPGLPIAAGNYIGIDTVRDSGGASGSTMRGQMGSDTVSLATTLPNGGAPVASVPVANIEAFVQATVEADADGDLFGDESQDQCPAASGPTDGCPLNTISLGKPKLNKSNGTATVPVTVPGPGALTLAGKGVVTRSAQTSRSRAVSAAGTLNLVVKPRGKAKRKLSSAGTAKVTVAITYTPTGGKPNGAQRKIKLRKL